MTTYNLMLYNSPYTCIHAHEHTALEIIIIGIHVCWYAGGGEVLSDQPLRPIPVEVWGGVPDTWQVDAGCRAKIFKQQTASGRVL